MKRKDYQTYNYKQLLRDEFFINSHLNPTTESKVFWENLQKDNTSFSEEFYTAKHLLGSIPYRMTELSPSDETILVNRIRNSIAVQKSKKRIKNIFTYTSVAAGLIFVCLFFWHNMNVVDQQDDIFQIAQQLKPESPIDNIQLSQSGQSELVIYGNESDIMYDNEGNLFVDAQHDIKENIEENIDPDKSSKPLSQLAVPPGKRSLLTLSDGTKVWVNANSRVIYPDVFDENVRYVYVQGEAFLDVKHDAERPFLVYTDKMTVTVKGTSFNVSAYENDKEVSVVLVTGSVKVNASDNEQLLTPNEMLHIEDGRIYKEEVNVQNHISWRYGAYTFDNEKFSVILQKLSRYYGIDINWDKAVEDLYCSGSLNLSDNIDKLLAGLKTAVPVKYTKSSDKIDVTVKP